MSDWYIWGTSTNRLCTSLSCSTVYQADWKAGLDSGRTSIVSYSSILSDKMQVSFSETVITCCNKSQEVSHILCTSSKIKIIGFEIASESDVNLWLVFLWLPLIVCVLNSSANSDSSSKILTIVTNMVTNSCLWFSIYLGSSQNQVLLCMGFIYSSLLSLA